MRHINDYEWNNRNWLNKLSRMFTYNFATILQHLFVNCKAHSWTWEHSLLVHLAKLKLVLSVKVKKNYTKMLHRFNIFLVMCPSRILWKENCEVSIKLCLLICCWISTTLSLLVKKLHVARSKSFNF